MNTNTKDWILKEAKQYGNDLHIDLWYPDKNPAPGSTGVNAFVIGLMHVRASDGIRVSYDFDRDGWKIEQPTISQWEVDDKVCDEGWTEVAFAKSWQLDKNGDKK